MAVTDEMVCFALYAASRATSQAYRRLLAPWGLTYPQYLTLAVLWHEGPCSVSELGETMQLDSGTLSPLLRRLEEAGYLERIRSSDDERVVTVSLTERAGQLRTELSGVPAAVAAGTGLPDGAAAADLIATLRRLTATMQAVGIDTGRDPGRS